MLGTLGLAQQTRTLRGQVLQMLRDALVAGEPGPGERINEAQLAASFAVSRGTIREALRNLEQEGLVVTIPHRGTFVRELTPEEVAHVFEVRFALEYCAATGTAQRLTPGLRAALRERLGTLERAHTAGTFREQLDADLGFHELICEASGNEILLKQWRSLAGLIAAGMHGAGPEVIGPLQSPAAHRGLLEAVESGDEDEIRRVWKAHFDDGMQQVVEAVRKQRRASGSATTSQQGAEDAEKVLSEA